MARTPLFFDPAKKETPQTPHPDLNAPAAVGTARSLDMGSEHTVDSSGGTEVRRRDPTRSSMRWDHVIHAPRWHLFPSLHSFREQPRSVQARFTRSCRRS